MRKSLKRLLSCFMAVVMAALIIPSFSAVADEYSVSYSADASTMDRWKDYFGTNHKSTENAGMIWLDKSVLTDADAFPKGTVALDKEGNALVALSALAANKTIVGYDNVPTDTIFVLDVSLSMRNSLDELVRAANESIKTLFELNTENRIGVILYSGYWGIGASNTDTATVILPVDRYISWNAEGDFLFYDYEEAGDANNIFDDKISVRVADGITNSAGETVSTSNSRVYGGSTYIQNAMYKAYQTFDAVESTVVESGLQKGEKRIPVMVFMSDGAPTAATTEYTNIGTSNVSNGKAESGEVTDVAFLTQLTAAFVRGKIEEKYERDMLFYTLGGVGTRDSDYAKSVLNPKGVTESLWNTYVNANGTNMTLYVPTTDKVNSDGTLNWYSPSIPTGNQICIDNQNYADGYYLAENVGDLIDNFKNIIEAISIQTKYYPTDIQGSDANSSGYVTFVDEIGEFMEITDVKGILLGDVLFDGGMLTSKLNNSEDGLGTVDAPTELGDKVIQAVRSRIGVDLETGRMLFDEAFKHGQLSYTSETEFSNYIGWYAKEDGSYCGFWAEGVTEAPAEAVYINRSYGFLGETGDSDMLFMYVQVHTRISDGSQTMIWKIPAALVPVVQYNVVFDGESLENSENITLTVEEAQPIRLVFEVGLNENINKDTIFDIMVDADEKHITDNGFLFYSNLWDNGGNGENADDVATYTYFEPSHDNELYYYAADADMYYLDENGNYNRIDWYNESYFDPNRTFYTAQTVFEVGENETNATVKTVYIPITKSAFDAKVKGNDGYWYIPKGEVKASNNEFVAKSENISGTLDYVVLSFAEYNTEHEHYHANALLGNNLEIKITAIKDQTSEPESSEPESSEPESSEPESSEPESSEPESSEPESSEPESSEPELSAPESSESEPVEPGDASNMLLWVILIAVSGFALVTIHKKQRNNF